MNFQLLITHFDTALILLKSFLNFIFLDFSFPLFFRKSVNDYKLSSLSFQNSGLELSDKRNELSNKLLTLKQNVSILAEQLQIAQRTVNYTKQLAEAEKLKFNNGVLYYLSLLLFTRLLFYL
jgi:outer membrane protein TolC